MKAKKILQKIMYIGTGGGEKVMTKKKKKKKKNKKHNLPKASTNCNITPPIWRSPLTRKVLTTSKSVTVMSSCHEPSTTPPSDIILTDFERSLFLR